MRQTEMIPEYKFELDLHAEVFEACAYHRWGLFDSTAHSLATFVLGGGVPKNYKLQPEPALRQVLRLYIVRGYAVDLQITTARVTDGSLSSSPHSEPVLSSKVDKNGYQHATESAHADYAPHIPFLIKPL